MHRRFVLPCLLLVSCAGLYAQSEDELKLAPPETEVAPRTSFEELGEATPLLEEATSVRESAQNYTVVREEYLKVAQQKAALMDDAALRGEVERMRREVRELQALAALDAARKQLRGLIEEHPETAAARTAERMLRVPAEAETILRPGVPTYADPKNFEGPTRDERKGLPFESF